ncbi:MAG: hypothetical protein ACO2PN_28570 [Pyrobaculum sp.]|jgi:hypothetical protein
MANQNLPVVPAFTAVRSVHDHPASANQKAEYTSDLLKVVFIAAAPPIIMLLGAIAAVNVAHEYTNIIAKIEHGPVDEAVREEFKEKLLRLLWIWPLIPGLQLGIAAFALVAGSLHNERAESVAVWAYMAGLFASLAAYTLYEPFFALFIEFWKPLTEFTYLGSVLVTYHSAYLRLIYKGVNKNRI